MPQAIERKPTRSIRCEGFQARAAVMPASIEPADRRFVVTISTGVRMLRVPILGDPFYEELEISDQAIRMDRVNVGTGVLAWHDWDTREGHIGTTERGWIEKSGTNGEGDVRVQCRLSKRDEVAGLWTDIQDGILRSISAGYRVYSYVDVTKADEEVRVLRAVDWEIMEVTFCSVPEDAGASIRAVRSAESPWEATIESGNLPASGERTMPQNEVPSAAPATPSVPATETRSVATATLPEAGAPPVSSAPAPTAPVQAAAHQAPDATRAAHAPAVPAHDPFEAMRTAERLRTDEILRSAEAAGASHGVARDLVTRGVSAADARAELRERFARDGGPETRSQHIGILRDERDKFRTSVEDALLTRYSPSKWPATEFGRRYVGFSLIELCRECARVSGVDVSQVSKMEIVKRVLATTDFPIILGNVANKTLRRSYDELVQEWRGTMARVVTVPDFKPVYPTQLSAGPELLKIEEGAEIRYGAMSDGRETYSLATYGRKVAITRQAVVNDDLSAFTRIPALLAAAVRRLEDALVYGVLTSNPLMSDGFALFSPQHGNLGDKVLGQAGLDQMRGKMRVQKGLSGEFINVLPRQLVVPAALETVAKQLMGSEWVPQTPSTVNTFRYMNQPIVHPLLDANSLTAWYASASPDQIDIIEVAYLEGENGPMLETDRDSDIDGYCWYCREDIAAAPIDWRGIYKSTGTV